MTMISRDDVAEAEAAPLPPSPTAAAVAVHGPAPSSPLPPPPTDVATPTHGPAPSSGDLRKLPAEIVPEEIDGVSGGLQALTLDAKKELLDANKELEIYELPPDFAVDGEEVGSEDIKWVKMPRDQLFYILGSKRESEHTTTLEDYGWYTQEDIERGDPNGFIRESITMVQEMRDEFYRYQAWVHDLYERHGCVMVPEDYVGSTEELQQEMDEFWYSNLNLPE